MKKARKMLALILSIFCSTLLITNVSASSNNLYVNKFVQVDSGKTVIAGSGQTSNSYGIVLTTVLGVDTGTKKTKVVVRRCSTSSCSSFTKSVTSSPINLGDAGSVQYTTMGYIGSGYWQGRYVSLSSYADWEGYSTLQGTSVSNSLA